MSQPTAPDLEIDHAAYSRFVALLSLVRVRLAGCEITTHQDHIAPKNTAVQIVQTSQRSHAQNEQADSITFKVSSELTFVAKDDAKNEFAKISVAYEFQYVIEENTIEAAQLEDFLDVFEKYNLPLNSWPFLREFVHNTMGRMDLPIYTLPLLRPLDAET